MKLLANSEIGSDFRLVLFSQNPKMMRQIAIRQQSHGDSVKSAIKQKFFLTYTLVPGHCITGLLKE